MDFLECQSFTMLSSKKRITKYRNVIKLMCARKLNLKTGTLLLHFDVIAQQNKLTVFKSTLKGKVRSYCDTFIPKL